MFNEENYCFIKSYLLVIFLLDSYTIVCISEGVYLLHHSLHEQVFLISLNKDNDLDRHTWREHNLLTQCG